MSGKVKEIYLHTLPITRKKLLAKGQPKLSPELLKYLRSFDERTPQELLEESTLRYK